VRTNLCIISGFVEGISENEFVYEEDRYFERSNFLPKLISTALLII